MLELNKIYNVDYLEGIEQIEPNSVDLVFADPPFNILVNENVSVRDKTQIREAEFDKVIFNVSQFVDKMTKVLRDGGTFLFFSGTQQITEYINSIKKNNLRFSNFLVWYNPLGFPSIRKRSFQNHCQLIIFGHKEINKKYTFNFKTSREMKNLLEFNGCVSFEYSGGNPGEYVRHPTQKPTKLYEYLIEVTTNVGDIVLDPLIGSGTTAVACKKLNRNFIGFEINPEYCKIANDRLKKYNTVPFSEMW